jgi:hypothetical protein
MSIAVCEALIKIMKPDNNGVTRVFTLDELRAALPKHMHNSLNGNGSAVFQNDRGLGKKYLIVKDKRSGKIEAVKLIGWASHNQTTRAAHIPSGIRRKIMLVPKKRCSVCFTGSKLQIDHKDGRKSTVINVNVNNPNEYQLLCQHCNVVKREVCKKCEQTGQRYDARPHGFKKGWTVGNIKYHPIGQGCTGCYWHDPIAFIKVSSK